MGFGRGRDDYATTPTIEESTATDVNECTDAIEQPGGEDLFLCCHCYDLGDNAGKRWGVHSQCDVW